MYGSERGFSLPQKLGYTKCALRGACDGDPAIERKNCSYFICNSQLHCMVLHVFFAEKKKINELIFLNKEDFNFPWEG